jgi:WD40 repeat protein
MSALERVGSLQHGKRSEVLCLHSTAGNALATGGTDGTVRIWDLAAGKAARALIMPPPPAGEDKAVTAVCMGESEATCNFVYAAVGVHVYGFDLRAPGMLLREAAWSSASLAKDEISHLALHESGRVLAAADDAGDVNMVDVAGGATTAAAAAASAPGVIHLGGAHSSICSSVAFRPGAATECVSAGLDAVVVRWDWRAATRLDTWPLMRRPIEDVLADAAEKALGLQQQQQQQQQQPGAPPPTTTPTTTQQPAPPQQQLFNPRHAHSLSFAPDGGAFAVALGDGSVEVRLTQSGEPIAAVDAHRAAASQAQFCPQLLPAVRTRMGGSAGGSSSGEAPFSEGVMARWLPMVTAGDDRRVRVWTVEGVAGRGRRSSDSKRQRRAADDDGVGGDDASSDEEDVYGEPGFRAVASAKLAYKPNAVAAAVDAHGRALVCVATCADDGTVSLFKL